MSKRRQAKGIYTAQCLGGPFDGAYFMSEGFEVGEKYELTGDGEYCPVITAVYQLLIKGGITVYKFVPRPKT
jgi:hypothetical protein